MSAPRLIALDALRGGAILAVLIFHFAKPTGYTLLDTVLAPLAVAGWAGVDLFFVLSGYLVGGIVLTEVTHAAGFDWRRFITRRALRLWPVLYLYLIALAAVGYDPQALWPALLHLQNYADHAPSHLWSLAVEEHFYVVAAVMLPWLARTGPTRMFAVLASVIVATSALRIGALAVGEPADHAQWQTQFRVDALAVGVLLAALSQYRPTIFDRLSAARGPLLIVAAICFAMLASDPPELVRWGPGLIVAWVMGAALVLLAAGTGGSAPAQLRPLAQLGLIAYPLYVWHPSIGHLAATISGAAGVIDIFAVLIIEVMASIFTAWAIHRLVEMPFIRLRDNLPFRLAAEPNQRRLT